ncbi:MAG TPA: glutamine-hydrolyzing carbamoyl-phosphate synthase small subunit [Acidimicrobiales bacterium]
MTVSGSNRPRPQALLVLADGTTFEGEAIGHMSASSDSSIATGELVFNTSMSGYQEILTDPSYAGQVISFTYPHIGSYGVTGLDDQAARPHCRGLIVRDLVSRPSNFRAESDLESFLIRHGVSGMTGVDTRRLTRHVRSVGAMPCAFGTADRGELLAAAQLEPGTAGMDLVGEVTTREVYRRAGGARRVVAFDYGIKRTILDRLAEIASVDVVPASTSAAAVLEMAPDGVFLSNGPGDPAALPHLAKEIKGLLGEVPVFGICLGHQLLASALGGSTFKLPFGHHGANQPVRRLATGIVEITAENHGYAVSPGSVASADVTHLNLNDGVIEGISCRDLPAFSVQYHPEAGPGPHDARYLFGLFAELMDASK